MNKTLVSLALLLTLGCDAEPAGRPEVIDLSAPVMTEENGYNYTYQQHRVTVPAVSSVPHDLESTTITRNYKGLDEYRCTIVDKTADSAPLHAVLSDDDAEASLLIENEAVSLGITNSGKYIVNNLHIFTSGDEVVEFLQTAGIDEKVTVYMLALLSAKLDTMEDGAKWGVIKKGIAAIFIAILDKWAKNK